MKRDDQNFAALVPVGLCLGVALGTVAGFFMDDPARGLGYGAGVGASLGVLLFGLTAKGRDAANDD